MCFVKRYYPDIFKITHKLIQYGCNIGRDKYPVTVASDYNLLGCHSSKLVSSTSVKVDMYIIVHVSCLHSNENHQMQVVLHQHQWMVQMYEHTLT